MFRLWPGRQLSRRSRAQGRKCCNCLGDLDAPAPPICLRRVNLRGQTLPVIDLSQAIGMSADSGPQQHHYRHRVQPFGAGVPGGRLDRIVNMNWEAIPPPASAGRQHTRRTSARSMTRLVEIIDRKKSLPKSCPTTPRFPARTRLEGPCWNAPAAAKCCWWMTQRRPATVVTPSDSWGCSDAHGRTTPQGIGTCLKARARQWPVMTDKLLMIFTDAEMPETTLPPDHRDSQRPAPAQPVRGAGAIGRCPAASTTRW